MPTLVSEDTMEDDDIIATLYFPPYWDLSNVHEAKIWPSINEEAMDTGEELDSSHVEEAQSSQVEKANSSQKTSQKPPERESQLHGCPRVVLRWSEPPASSRGILLGSSARCDVQLSSVHADEAHLALTFNENRDLVIRDIGSSRGTQVTYIGDRRSQIHHLRSEDKSKSAKDKLNPDNCRKNFEWIVGGHRYHNFLTQWATSEFLRQDELPPRVTLGSGESKISFWVDPGSKEYTDTQISRFLPGWGPPSMLKQFFFGAKKSTPQIIDPLYSYKLVGRGSYASVYRVWNVSTGDSRALKQPNNKAEFLDKPAKGTQSGDAGESCNQASDSKQPKDKAELSNQLAKGKQPINTGGLCDQTIESIQRNETAKSSDQPVGNEQPGVAAEPTKSQHRYWTDEIGNLKNFRGSSDFLINIQEPYYEPTLDGVPFIYMDYCPGGNLAQRIANGRPLDYEECLIVMHQCASGLKKLHEASTVHRDIKPENIMIEHRGKDIKVKIADFGLSSRNANFRTNAGTGIYKAPEIERNAGQNTIALDIWSLGAMALSLLTGTSLSTLCGNRDKQLLGIDATNQLIATVKEEAKEHPSLLLSFVRDKMVVDEPANRANIHTCMDTFAALLSKHRESPAADSIRRTRAVGNTMLPTPETSPAPSKRLRAGNGSSYSGVTIKKPRRSTSLPQSSSLSPITDVDGDTLMGDDDTPINGNSMGPASGLFGWPGRR